MYGLDDNNNKNDNNNNLKIGLLKNDLTLVYLVYLEDTRFTGYFFILDLRLCFT